jgi:hypothetical protein
MKAAAAADRSASGRQPQQRENVAIGITVAQVSRGKKDCGALNTVSVTSAAMPSMNSRCGGGSRTEETSRSTTAPPLRCRGRRK